MMYQRDVLTGCIALKCVHRQSALTEYIDGAYWHGVLKGCVNRVH